MRAERNINDKILNGIGLMIVVPVLVIMGSLAILMLATPVILAATVIAFATIVLWLGTLMTRETPVTGLMPVTGLLDEEETMCETIDLIPVLEAEPMEMVGSLDSAPNEVVTAAITKVVGPCPLGWMPGNNWKIDSEGNLSRPMCSPGATALSALLRTSEGDAIDRSACCDCPVAGREVTFTVREKSVDDKVGALAEEMI
jgi:hypothetical protein